MGRLTGCCCCFNNLHDGARAVGITLLVLATLGLISHLAHASMQSDQIRTVDGERREENSTVHLAIRIAVCLLQVVFSALLIRGVEKGNRKLILAWLIFFGIVNGLSSVGMAVIFIFVCTTGVWWLILLVLGLCGLVGVFWYWFVVVLHYYQEMREQDGFAYGKQENEGEKHTL